MGNGQAMRQPGLIATPAPAPYSAPDTVGRIASELRKIQLKSRTRTPPAIVLPMPQAKSMIHGGTRNPPATRNVLPTGLVQNVEKVRTTTTSNAAMAAEYTVVFGSLPAGMLSCAAIQTSTIASVNANYRYPSASPSGEGLPPRRACLLLCSVL